MLKSRDKTGLKTEVLVSVCSFSVTISVVVGSLGLQSLGLETKRFSSVSTPDAKISVSALMLKVCEGLVGRCALSHC